MLTVFRSRTGSLGLRGHAATLTRKSYKPTEAYPIRNGRGLQGSSKIGSISSRFRKEELVYGSVELFHE